MIYNFNCKLKGHTFKYKVEAESLPEAKVKVRNIIKNAVEIEEVKPITPNNSMPEFMKDVFKMNDSDIFKHFDK